MEGRQTGLFSEYLNKADSTSIGSSIRIQYDQSCAQGVMSKYNSGNTYDVNIYMAHRICNMYNVCM